MKMTRDNCAAIWDDHFKTILLLLLETLGDNDVRVNDQYCGLLISIFIQGPSLF